MEFEGKLPKDIITNVLNAYLLPQNIIDKMNILLNLIEMAKVTRVPLDFLVTRGQQIKVLSQMILPGTSPAPCVGSTRASR